MSTHKICFYLEIRNLNFNWRLEQSCIQDLMYHAVHAQRTLRPMLEKVGMVIACSVNKSKKDSKDQESIKSSTTPVPGYKIRVPTRQGKVREICFFFKVREKSGNSVKWPGKLENLQKSGNFKIMLG